MRAMTLQYLSDDETQSRKLGTPPAFPFGALSDIDHFTGRLGLRRHVHEQKIAEKSRSTTRRVIERHTRLFALQKYSLVKPKPRNQLFGSNKRASAGFSGKVATAIGLTVMFAPRCVIPFNPNPALFRLGVSNGSDIFDGGSVAFNIPHLENVQIFAIA